MKSIQFIKPRFTFGLPMMQCSRLFKILYLKSPLPKNVIDPTTNDERLK